MRRDKNMPELIHFLSVYIVSNKSGLILHSSSVELYYHFITRGRLFHQLKMNYSQIICQMYLHYAPFTGKSHPYWQSYHIRAQISIQSSRTDVYWLILYYCLRGHSLPHQNHASYILPPNVRRCLLPVQSSRVLKILFRS